MTDSAGKTHIPHVIDAHAVGHLNATGVRAADREFEQGLTGARDYARRNGGVGGLDDPNGPPDHPLSAWLAEQRLCHLEDRLSENRRVALESIEGWRWTRPRRPGR